MRKKDRIYTIIRSGLQGHDLSNKLLRSGLKLGVRTVGPNNEVQISLNKTWIPASEWAKAYHNDLQIEMKGMLERFGEMNEPIETQSEPTQKQIDWTKMSEQAQEFVLADNRSLMAKGKPPHSVREIVDMTIFYICEQVES